MGCLDGTVVCCALIYMESSMHAIVRFLGFKVGAHVWPHYNLQDSDRGSKRVRVTWSMYFVSI